MYRISIFSRVLALALFLSIVNMQHARSAADVTAECGPINSNITWLLANSPYEVCNTVGVAVLSGVTLTIEPGVTVRFQNGNSAKLIVAGTLIANGTATQPITFTSVVNTAGSWGGISADGLVATPAVINLDNAILEDGGAINSAELDAYHAVVTIARSIIRNGLGSGFRADHNAHFDVHDTSFTSNAQDAILLNTPSAGSSSKYSVEEM